MPRPSSCPTEILDQIVSSALEKCSHPALKPISGLSLANKQYRAVVLRRWFLLRSPVTIKDQSDSDILATLGMWIRCYLRNLSCTDAGLRLCNDRLKHLFRLKSADFDFNNHTPFKFRQAYTQLLDELPAKLTSLTLTGIPIINKTLLKAVASKFVGLIELRLCTIGRLECDVDCCGCCPDVGNRQRLLSVQYSPIPDVFENGRRLGRAFGTGLAPLTSLRTLSFGVYLSPEGLLQEHNQHDPDGDYLAEEVTSDPIARCAYCQECRDNYLKPTRQNEKSASQAIASRLPRLEMINWPSCFIRVREESTKRCTWGTTTFTVQRTDKAVEVQRVTDIIFDGIEKNTADTP